MGRNRIQYTGVRLDGFINEDRDDSSAISGLFFFFFHLLSFLLSSSIPLRISRIVVVSNIAIITLIPMIQKLVFGLGFALFTICFRYIYIYHGRRQRFREFSAIENFIVPQNCFTTFRVKGRGIFNHDAVVIIVNVPCQPRFHVSKRRERNFIVSRFRGPNNSNVDDNEPSTTTTRAPRTIIRPQKAANRVSDS